MSGARARGRPSKGETGLSRSEVLSAALKLLDADGERGLTMRALAKRLSVTPMALYHHVGNRDELIAALVDHVFGQIVTGVDEGHFPSEQIEKLLGAYCHQATKHPELVLAVFRDPNTLSGPLEDLTKVLRSNLQAMGLDLADVDRWLGLLVDYTHGYAVSEVAAHSEAKTDAQQPAYAQNIQLLTDMIKQAVGSAK